MSNVEIISKIDNCINSMSQCTIERRNFDDYNMYCIPIKRSKNLLMVHYIYDFSFDGFKIVRLKDITSVNHSDIENFHEMIYKKEKIFPPYPPKLCLLSYEDVFNFFINKNIEVECEDLSVNTFDIGKVMRVSESYLELHRFDSLGVWDEKNKIVSFSDISCVTWGNRYLNILSKYVCEK